MKKEFLSKLKRFSQQTFIPKQFRQPAVPQRFSPSDDSQAFSLNGFLVKQITQSSTFDQMFTSLRNFASPTPPSPFLWEKKSEGYYLLRPKPTEYSSVFVDFLFDNGVMDLISEITGQNLYLADISFIHHTPGIQNDWHRDTYIYDNQPVGPFPAIFKMIYYPL